MSQLSAIKERIKTISNIRKVTRAMELITKTKINSIRQNAINAKNYQETVKQIFESITKKSETEKFSEKETKPKKYIIAFLSHKGFCGGFNDKVLQNIRSQLKKDPLAPEIYMIGMRNPKWTYCLRRSFHHIEAKEKNYRQALANLIKKLSEEIRSRKNIEIYFVFNQFISILEQKPIVQLIYPFELANKKPEEILFEPDSDYLYDALADTYLDACFERAYWESTAGEYCSRLLAMKNANQNSELILNKLQLNYNKTRQSKITQELSEIVSAFDVLKLIKQKKEKTEE